MTDITIITRKEGLDEEKGIEAHLKEEQLLEQSKKSRDFFASMQTELDEIEGDLKNGLSYLDMKNDTLLSYMIDLCNIVLRKVRGESISGHASVERCVTYRVILEKIKAIDLRLAYQLNKIISLPEGAEEKQGIDIENLDVQVDSDDEEEEYEDEDEEDAAGHKNNKIDRDNQDNAGNDSENDEDDEFDGSSDSSVKDEEDVEENGDLKERLDRSRIMAKKVEAKKKNRSKISRDGVYKPPKLRSVVYDEDGSGSHNRRRDYNEIYQDDDNLDIVDEARSFKDDARTRYEEENYTRLRSDNPKKAKRKLKAKAKGTKGKKKVKGKRDKW